MKSGTRGVIVLVGSAMEDFARAYGHLRDPVIDVIDGLSVEDATAVQRFASRLAEALRRELPVAEATPGT